MQTGLNSNRKLARDLIERAESEAEAVGDLGNEAAQLAADELSDTDTKEIATKVRDAADAFLTKLGLSKP